MAVNAWDEDVRLPERLRLLADMKDEDGLIAASSASAWLRAAANEIERLRAQIDGSADGAR